MATMARPAPPPPPSHAHYILGQVRSGLAHLRATQALDKSTFERVDELLTSSVLRDSHGHEGSMTTTKDVQETEEERLGKRNAWLREALTDTSLLPSLVETAMQIAVPSAIMGDMQRQAVVQLVERSQKSIARAITDPKAQQRAGSGAWTSAKGAHSGLRKGFQAAGQGWQDLAQRRQESKQKSDEKRAERKEKKAMEKELKREREAIVRQRQVNMLDNGSAQGQSKMSSTSSDDHYTKSPSTMTATSSVSIPSRTGKGSLQSNERSHDVIDDETDDDEDDEDDEDEDVEPATHAEDGAMATVSCGRVDDEENCVTATTTFSPWPGLVLSNTLVAISDEKLPSVKDIDRIRYAPPPTHEANSKAPPRRLVPPQSSNTAQLDEEKRRSSLSSKQPDASSSADLTLSRHGLRELPNTPVHAPSSAHGAVHAPPPPVPSAMQSSVSPVSRQPSQPQQQPPLPPPHSYTPAHPDSAHSVSSTSTHPSAPTPARTEVRDTTEAKQKSWTRKLGL